MAIVAKILLVTSVVLLMMTVWRSVNAQAVEAKSATLGNRVFYVLPRLAAKLNTNGNVGNSLRAVVLLELSSESDRKAVEQNQEALLESFSAFFRGLEMFASDFRDTAKMEHVRSELLLRGNAIMESTMIRGVVFKSAIVE